MTVFKISLDESSEAVFLLRFETPNPEATPVIICPGGGYGLIGSSEADPVAERFLIGGYAPFILHYSIGSAITFTEGSEPDFSPVQDLRKAVQYLEQNRDELNLNKSKLLLAGFSAGAHLVGLYSGYAAKNPENFRAPDAVLLVYPLIALPTPGSGPNRMYRAIFGTDSPSEEALKSFDVATRAVQGFPKTFLYHSKPDTMVPFESSVSFEQVLTNNSIDHVFFKSETGRHAEPFSNDAWWESFLSWLSQNSLS
jgi:acetyl esterase/lipase